MTGGAEHIPGEVPFPPAAPAAGPDPSDVPEVRRYLREPSHRVPENAEVYERISHVCPDAESRADALSILGGFPLNARDFPAAERAYRHLVGLTWGTGWNAERTSCINLATVHLVQNRIFESLVLANRALALFTASGPEVGVCFAWRHLAAIYYLIDDWARLEQALPEAEGRLGVLAPRHAAQIGASLLHYRAALALRAGRIDEALAATERSAATAPPDSACYEAETRGRVLLAAGRPAEAAALLASARAAGGPDAGILARMDETAVGCVLATEGPERARDAAVALVQRLRRDSATISSGVRMRIADAMGRLLVGPCASPRDAWHAFDAAAAAALERMAELDRAVLDLPGLAHPTAADRAILDEYRARFVAEHRELLGVLVSLVEAGAQDPAVLAAVGLDGPAAICVCAWCRRVRGPERLWLQPASLVLPEARLDVTHGICDACGARVARGSDGP